MRSSTKYPLSSHAAASSTNVHTGRTLIARANARPNTRRVRSPYPRHTWTSQWRAHPRARKATEALSPKLKHVSPQFTRSRIFNGPACRSHAHRTYQCASEHAPGALAISPAYMDLTLAFTPKSARGKPGSESTSGTQAQACISSVHTQPHLQRTPIPIARSPHVPVSVPRRAQCARYSPWVCGPRSGRHAQEAEKPVPSSVKHVSPQFIHSCTLNRRAYRSYAHRPCQCASEYTPGALAISPTYVDLTVACIPKREETQSQGHESQAHA